MQFEFADPKEHKEGQESEDLDLGGGQNIGSTVQ